MQDYKTSDQKFWTTVRKNHPDYLRWFFADTASALGASLVAIPISLASYYLTGSLSQAGVIGAASSAGSMIMTIPAGMIIDRFNKKKLLFFYGLSQIGIWSTFSLLLYLGKFTFILLFFFSLFAGMITGTFGGLTNAILRFIIPENLLVQAQGRNQTRDNIIWMVGLPLGGFLYGLAPVIPFIVQTLCGLGPLYASKTLSMDLGKSNSGQQYSFREFWSDSKYSLTWIWKYPLLRTIFSIDIFSNFANFFLIVSIDLWLAYLKVDGWIIGLTSTMFTLGMIVGGLLQDRLIKQFPGRNIIRATMFWQLMWYLFLLAFSQYWPLIAVAAFFIVVPSIACNSYSGGLLALSAPPEKIGKCSAGARLMMGLLPIIVSASAGAFLAAIGFQASMALCALCSVISCLIAASSVLRTLPKASEFNSLPVCE
ncbi:MFS transporter [Corynebacterium macginleyi]|uniref:MFS transporter n=1 Tax=Corynebacterium macginleyi TaxID=38290 RepID=UPI00190CE194|nr:MFS transporter [Corynebacterium macginleyi]MBK4178590.1 MFS transporter [Corynebacterium macginleyi]